MRYALAISLSATILLAAVAVAQVYPIRWDDDDLTPVTAEVTTSDSAVSAEVLRLRPRETEPFACTLDTLGSLYVQNDVCDQLTFTDTQLCICASVEGVADWTFISSSQGCEFLFLDCP